MGIFIAEFSLSAAGLGVCYHLGLQQGQRTACANYSDDLQRTFETALGTALALLGGRILASGSRQDSDP